MLLLLLLLLQEKTFSLDCWVLECFSGLLVLLDFLASQLRETLSNLTFLLRRSALLSLVTEVLFAVMVSEAESCVLALCGYLEEVDWRSCYNNWILKGLIALEGLNWYEMQFSTMDILDLVGNILENIIFWWKYISVLWTGEGGRLVFYNYLYSNFSISREIDRFC